MPALADLRIAVFREWPYLYEGDLVYETGYLDKYTASPRASLIGAFQGETLVGASTCLPLTDATADVRAPFAAAGLDPGGYFYFGESVLRPEWRGRGVGVKFFAARAAEAEGFASTTFCAVRRRPDEPRRPPQYRPLNDFWTNRGYTEQPELVCRMAWREVGAAVETPHDLVFWTKTR